MRASSAPSSAIATSARLTSSEPAQRVNATRGLAAYSGVPMRSFLYSFSTTSIATYPLRVPRCVSSLHTTAPTQRSSTNACAASQSRLGGLTARARRTRKQRRCQLLMK